MCTLSPAPQHRVRRLLVALALLAIGNASILPNTPPIFETQSNLDRKEAQQIAHNENLYPAGRATAGNPLLRRALRIILAISKFSRIHQPAAEVPSYAEFNPFKAWVGSDASEAQIDETDELDDTSDVPVADRGDYDGEVEERERNSDRFHKSETDSVDSVKEASHDNEISGVASIAVDDDDDGDESADSSREAVSEQVTTSEHVRRRSIIATELARFLRPFSSFTFKGVGVRYVKSLTDWRSMGLMLKLPLSTNFPEYDSVVQFPKLSLYAGVCFPYAWRASLSVSFPLQTIISMLLLMGMVSFRLKNTKLPAMKQSSTDSVRRLGVSITYSYSPRDATSRIYVSPSVSYIPGQQFTNFIKPFVILLPSVLLTVYAVVRGLCRCMWDHGLWVTLLTAHALWTLYQDVFHSAVIGTTSTSTAAPQHSDNPSRHQDTASAAAVDSASSRSRRSTSRHQDTASAAAVDSASSRSSRSTSCSNNSKTTNCKDSQSGGIGSSSSSSNGNISGSGKAKKRRSGSIKRVSLFETLDLRRSYRKMTLRLIKKTPGITGSLGYIPRKPRQSTTAASAVGAVAGSIGAPGSVAQRLFGQDRIMGSSISFQLEPFFPFHKSLRRLLELRQTAGMPRVFFRYSSAHSAPVLESSADDADIEFTENQPAGTTQQDYDDLGNMAEDSRDFTTTDAESTVALATTTSRHDASTTEVEVDSIEEPIAAALA